MAPGGDRSEKAIRTEPQKGTRDTKGIFVNFVPSWLILGFAQKILGGHRPPLQLGVRNCRGAL